MKIDLYSIMRNEERMLPYFFRHYDQFVNRYFIFEDQSTDSTREILSNHPNVKILDVEKHGIYDQYWVESLWPQYEIYSKDGTDWVFCVDADEFIYHPDLLHQLSRHKRFGTKILSCLGFTMYSESFPTTDGQIYDEIRMGLRDRWSSKCAIFSPDIKLRYTMGRHKLAEYPLDAPIRSKNGIRLLHYRFLGKEYFQQRDINNIDRINTADGGNKVYDPDMKRNLPNDKKGPIFPFYEENKSKLIDCLGW